MWYEQLLKQLIVSKIKDKEQAKGIEFLDLFFKQYHMVSGETVPPLALLGLLDKLYKKYEPLENKTVELTPFARDLTFLGIILLKASFDDAIWNSDFDFTHPTILSALGIDLSANIAAHQVNPVNNDWGDIELPTDISQISGLKAKINFLERITWKAWHYDISLDFGHTLDTIIKNKPDLIPEIVEYYKSFASKSDVFDEFICKLKEIAMATQQQDTRVEPKLHEEQQEKPQHSQQLEEEQRRQKQLDEEQRRQKQLDEEQRRQKQLDEEQRLQNEARLQHQQFVTTSLSQVDDALSTLRGRISLVNQHHSPAAFETATNLLSGPERARREYSTALHQPGVIIAQASTEFKEVCAILINNAKPLLENDLAWGDYLKNLLKMIVNAVVGAGSFGGRDNFFPLKPSESTRAIVEVERNLDLVNR